MEKTESSRKIEHHTDWCSSMATSVKKDGSLRVCLDPKRLNLKAMTTQDTNPGETKSRVCRLTCFLEDGRQSWLLVYTSRR